MVKGLPWTGMSPNLTLSLYTPLLVGLYCTWIVPVNKTRTYGDHQEVHTLSLPSKFSLKSTSM